MLATGACRVTGTTSVEGREAIVLECDHPRTIELTADRPDFAIRISVDRIDGVILRLEESMGGVTTRDAIVTSYVPDAAPAAVGVRVHLPAGHDRHLLAGSGPVGAAPARVEAPGAGVGPVPANRTRIAEPAIVITIVARTAVNSSPETTPAASPMPAST